MHHFKQALRVRANVAVLCEDDEDVDVDDEMP